MTSHDVVAVARRTLNMKKIGHCGTLDPMATGLLILVLGRGTKIQDLLMAEEKEYVGTIRLGENTNTQDKDGHVIETREVPALTREQIDGVFGRYTGEFLQTPPMVSAIKQNGVPLYKLARKGQEVPREPRQVEVFSYEILRVELPEIEFRVRCSKGFYVRTYAQEIGNDLGCGAHLSALRRTRSGRFGVEGAITFDELKAGPREVATKRLLSLPEVSRLRGA